MHWQSLFSLTAISVLMLNSTKQLATAVPLSFPDSYLNFSVSKILLADNSLAINKQNQTTDLFQQLNLTSEQKQKINQIHRKYQQQLRKKRHTLTVLQQQLSNMMVGTETEKLLRSKNRQLTKIRHEISTLRFESMLATREILTLQQRQKFRDLVRPQLEK